MASIEEFREFGKAMVDYVADMMKNVEALPVVPNIKPGDIRDQLPGDAPETPDTWQDIMADVDRIIMPGVTHWRHPHFHAYFAAGNSYPPIVADILSGAINGPGFSWISMPASTELETVMVDWVANLFGLPDHFKFSKKGSGGGVIQSFASDATYYTLLLARARIIGEKLEKVDLYCKLVMYASKTAHSSVERAATLAGVRLKYIDTDEMFVMKTDSLIKTIKEDKEAGLIPFFLVASFGTTTSCVFDNINSLGPVCSEEKIWLHVDAAYAGSALVCEEYRYLMTGIEHADSFCVNLHKWLLVTLDCALLWVKNREEIQTTFNKDPTYLKHPMNVNDLPEYRHWQIPLGRRFRSLKVWFTLRLYGKVGLQKHIRNHVNLAHEFEALIRSDERFEISYPVTMGLVCFRLKASNELNEKLNAMINIEGEIHMTPSTLGDKFILRLAICAIDSSTAHMQFAFNNIIKNANILLCNK